MPCMYCGKDQAEGRLGPATSSDDANMPQSLRRELEMAASRMVGETVDQNQQPGRRPAPHGAAQPRAQADPAAAPFAAVLQRLLSDPSIAAHLQGGHALDEGDDHARPDFGPPPGDPVERLKWDVAHGVAGHLSNARRARKAAKQQQAARQQAGNTRLLQQLSQTDPLFNQTYAFLMDYLRRLPPDAASRVIPQVDSNPPVFLNLYGHIRQFVEQAVAPGAGLAKQGDSRAYATQAQEQEQEQEQAQAQAQAGFAPQYAAADTDPRQVVRRTVAGRMSAPSLENAGYGEDMPPAASRQAQLATLRAKINAQGAGPGEFEKYLELQGVADRMLR